MYERKALYFLKKKAITVISIVIHTARWYYMMCHAWCKKKIRTMYIDIKSETSVAHFANVKITTTGYQNVRRKTQQNKICWLMVIT